MGQRSLFRPIFSASRLATSVAARRNKSARLLALEGLEARQLLTVTANPDAYVVLEGTALNVATPGVLSNDRTNTGTALAITGFTQPTKGTLTLNPNGSFRFTPTAGATGADQFNYTIADTKGGTATTTVQLNVTAATDEASVFAGTQLASVSTAQSALLNPLLSGLTGSNINLSVADYNGLASGSINGNQLATALGAELGVTPGQALTTNATLGQIFTAAATVAQTNGNTAEVTALQDLATSVGGLTAPVQLGNLLQVNPNDGSLANTNVNALDLATGSIQLFNFKNVATTPTPVTISTAALGLPGIASGVTISPQVVEPPIVTTGPAGTQFHTAAIRARIDLALNTTTPATALDTAAITAALAPLGFAANATLNGLSIYTEVAEGQGTIASVNALAGVVTLQATPGLANVYVGNIDPTVFFDRTHTINPATDVTYGTVGTLGVTNALVPALNATTGIQIRGVAQGAAPTASTETFNAPFPQSQTVTTSAAFLTNLANTLTQSLSVQLSGPLGTIPTATLNGTVLPLVSNVVTGAVSPVLAPVLTNVADPALRLLGTGVGDLDLTVQAVSQVAGPGANADFTTTQVGQAVIVPVLNNDAVLPTEPVTVTAVTQPTHGTTAINADGSVTYTPVAGYIGPDIFTYTITDPNGLTSSAAVTVDVLPLPPVVNPDTYAATENAPLTVTAAAGVLSNDTNPQGTGLTAVIDTNPTRGSVTLNPDGSFTYTPTTGSTGPDTFTYRATDGSIFSAPVTVTVNVAAALPTANADAYTATVGTPLTVPAATGVLSNDTDPNGLALTAAVATQPTHGTLTLNADGSLTYTPTAGYIGTDTFTYQAADSAGQSTPTTVTVNVQSAGLPVANPDTYLLSGGTTLTVPAATGVLANDTDPNGLPLTAAVVTQPTHGTLTLNADGTLTYTPTAGFNGTDTFTYQAVDSAGQSTPTTVTLNVTPNVGGNVTNPPVVTTNPITGTVGVPITNVPVATFTDGDGTTPPASYTATITYGDGTTSPGTVTEANGVYTVSGTHTYGTAGTFPVGVNIVRATDGVAAAGTTSALIAPAAVTTGPGSTASSLTGSVYLDYNRNGLDDPTDYGVATVVITLTGTTTTGQAVTMTTSTDASGHYAFANLLPGTYQISVARPTAFNNGAITPGTAGGVVQAQAVTGINLAASTAATGYNIGELTRADCRLDTPVLRTLLRVGPVGSLPSTFRPVTINPTGPIATYLPTLAARASLSTTVGTQGVHASAVHKTKAHVVKVQHSKPKPRATTHRHK